ncbi:hypothetical protein [Dolichospermum sp. LEGE 00246]|jgi:hypothetical protein|uniref:hypothetical protein n=1 Tax=Dolichospermum sp. LEGE 00246 TaxID=1828605 RepID=UPI00187E7973|nr:hypothetical protein [Dolichospermum sp. LEGE 00246]MBE9257576.1 hypothetical protein [Dolichospermum sp. LEGE 00246]
MINQFRSMLKMLEEHPDINVVVCNFNPPATIEELNAAKRYFNLTPAMIDFYSQANGIQICWERKSNKKPPRGGLAAGYINLLPVEEVFNDWKDIIYFSEADPQKPLHPLDFFIEEACAAFYLDGSDNPKVYYHYCGEEMSSLGVDFEGYLKLLLKSRGFWYWHTAIAQPQYVNPYVPISVEESNFREIMPQLFPDFDASDFQRLNNE